MSKNSENLEAIAISLTEMLGALAPEDDKLPKAIKPAIGVIEQAFGVSPDLGYATAAIGVAVMADRYLGESPTARDYASELAKGLARKSNYFQEPDVKE